MSIESRLAKLERHSDPDIPGSVPAEWLERDHAGQFVGPPLGLAVDDNQLATFDEVEWMDQTIPHCPE